MTFLVRLFCVFCITGVAAQAGEWRLQYRQTGVQLWSVDFITRDLGLAVGQSNNKGVILRTSDGGANWVSIPVDVPPLSHVRFADDFHVWASGAGGTVLHSSDQGLNWAVQHPGTTTESMKTYALRPTRVFSIGDHGSLYTSNDTGATWTKHAQNFDTSYKSIVFSGQNGWILSRKLWKTTDGGATWTSQDIPDAVPLYDIFFLNANTGWIVGGNKTVLKTTDGGASWLPQTAQIPYAPNLTGVDFTDEQNGLIVGRTHGVSSAGASADGGENWWYRGDITDFGTPYDIIMLNAERGWIVGDGFIISNNGVISAVEESPEAFFHKFTVNGASLEFSADITGRATISVSNLAGEEITRFVKEDIGRGENISLDISSLPSGSYFLSLGTGEKAYRRQFSILR